MVVITEANELIWPGPDQRPIPGEDASSLSYGPLPLGCSLMYATNFLLAIEKTLHEFHAMDSGQPGRRRPGHIRITPETGGTALEGVSARITGVFTPPSTLLLNTRLLMQTAVVLGPKHLQPFPPTSAASSRTPCLGPSALPGL